MSGQFSISVRESADGERLLEVEYGRWESDNPRPVAKNPSSMIRIVR